MSLQLTELNAYVLQKIVPRTTEIIYASSPIFSRLSTQNAEKFTGNSIVQRPVIVGELNGDFMSRGEGVNIDFVTTDAALTVAMTVAWVNISLFGFDAMNDDGPEAIFNQVELKFLNASMKMAKVLAVNMYLNGQGARTKYLNGFSEWYDNGVLFPTVGGQTRSDIVAGNAVGGLNAYTTTLTSFTLQALNTAYGNACWASDHPDIIPVTQNGWNLIWNGVQPAQRFYTTDNDLANVGFQNFRFNAADVVVDRYLPTGTNGVIFGMNTRYIEWYFSQVELFSFGWTGFKGAQQSIDVSGQFLVGSNLMVPNPRTGFKILSTSF